MNQYVDIGINLTHKSFNADREEIVKNAAEKGVFPLIITCTSVRASQIAADYAGKSTAGGTPMYSTAGVHPHDAKGCNESTIEQLRKLSKLPHVVAVGECGLDYDRDFSPRDVQKKWFVEQIKLAEEENMPLFLHERAAFADFTAILKEHRSICKRAVVHCFTGTDIELKTYLDLGCYIGITGWICDERRGMNLRRIVKNIPLSRLMIETDAPFLTPRNLRERPADNRNEPCYLPHIAAEIAKCRNESTTIISQRTTQNAKEFFKI